MSDLISRQDAIYALLEKGQRSRRYKLGEIWELNFDEIREALATVPSAEPVRHRLEKSDAGMTVAEYRARMIEAFHNADCDSLISVVVLPTEKEFQHLEWLLKKEYVPFLEKAKRHGKWKQTEVVHECFDIQGFKTWGIKYMCESCGFKTIAIEGHFAQYKYCPQCGARMDEE